jgi:hypothetical protein
MEDGGMESEESYKKIPCSITFSGLTEPFFGTYRNEEGNML